MLDFFKLNPHKQLKIGVLALISFSFLSPIILVLLMIFVGGASYGTNDLTFLFYTRIALLIIGALILIGGVLFPIIRLISLSHKYSKQLGRGDEHAIFMIGIVLIFLTWVFAYRPYLTTVTETGSSSSTLIIVLFFAGNILGLLLVLTGTVLMIRISIIYYKNLNPSPYPEVKYSR